jgi:malate dehydrogenase
MTVKISIIGAGELGAALARKLVERDFCHEVVLYDASGTVAQGKCLDLLQSAPILGFGTKLTGTQSLDLVEGSDIIILSGFLEEGAPTLAGEPAEKLLPQLGRLKGNSIMIAADTFSTRLLELVLKQARYHTRNVLGSAPLAIASAVKFLIADEIKCSYRDIKLLLLGLPPESLVIPWSMVSIGGIPIEKLVHVSVLRRIAGRIKTLWPLGPYALATAAAMICQDVVFDRGATQPCYAFLNGEYAQRNVFFIVPAKIGRRGIESVHEIPLDPVDRVAVGV